MDVIFTEWLGDADLVVIDGLNDQNGYNQDFLIAAMDYVLANDKAILVTSNNNINIKQCVKIYYPCHEPRANCFLILRELDGVSLRSAWYKHMVASDAAYPGNGESKLKALSSYNGANPAGIVLYDDGAESIAKKYAQLRPDIKIKIIGFPYDGGKMTRDYYLYDVADYDVFILHVGDTDGCRQFMNILPKIHDHAKKTVIIIDSLRLLRQHIEQTLQGDRDSILLTDRLKHMFAEELIAPTHSAKPRFNNS